MSTTELSPWASAGYRPGGDGGEVEDAAIEARRTPSYSVGPVRAPAYVAPARPFDAPQWDASPVDVTPVWQPGTGTVSEVGRPTDRAWATILRAAPVWLFAGPLCVAAVYLLDIRPWGWTVPIWAGVSLVAHLLIVWVDLAWNSPGSVERHRVNAAARLKRTELQHAQELRRAIVEAYLDHLERR